MDGVDDGGGDVDLLEHVEEAGVVQEHNVLQRQPRRRFHKRDLSGSDIRLAAGTDGVDVEAAVVVALAVEVELVVVAAVVDFDLESCDDASARTDIVEIATVADGEAASSASLEACAIPR